MAALVSVCVVVATGLTRITVAGDDGPVACPDRVLSSALRAGPEDPVLAQCVAASQQRMYAVAASLMGLVLISGLVSRRPD
ncbi:MAG: hypothetical protein ACR2K2_13430 [Mycobacteriales bacterium]